MKCAIQINKKSFIKWIIISILFMLFMIALWMRYLYLMREKGVEIAKEEEYIEFEKLFKKNKDEMQSFMELFNKSILKDGEYLILFNEEWYSDMQSGNRARKYVIVFYENNTFIVEENKEIEKELNENIELMEILNSINGKGVITRISIFTINDSIQIVKFWVDTEFTYFIKTNNGVTNAFAYCSNSECELYGYKNVEENWYMWISPAPE